MTTEIEFETTKLLTMVIVAQEMQNQSRIIDLSNKQVFAYWFLKFFLVKFRY